MKKMSNWKVTSTAGVRSIAALSSWRGLRGGGSSSSVSGAGTGATGFGCSGFALTGSGAVRELADVSNGRSPPSSGPSVAG
ncbi:MAG: hypothetical protein ACK58J_01380 [Planctomyces sp.]